MADKAPITCKVCGKEISEPVSFCPHCGAELPRDEDPTIGYWNFYGMIPDDEELTAGPMGARGWLRVAAVAVFFLGIVLGLGLNGWKWGFRWQRAWPVWAGAAAAAVILLALSFLVKKPEGAEPKAPKEKREKKAKKKS